MFLSTTKNMLKYAGYRQRPSIGNATKLISLALEQNLDLIGKLKNEAYSVHYLSNNPKPHKLFVFEVPIDLLSYAACTGRTDSSTAM